MKQILIVEDNELNMKLFGNLLVAQEYKVVRAVDGDIALKLVEEGLIPDLIVLDIQLPTISGLELIEILKRKVEFQNIPVIAVTAFAMKGDEESFKAKGCTDYISKPVDVLEFVKMIKSYLE